MGTEKALAQLLRQQISGSPPPGGSPAGLNMSGGTPNHKALAAATAYAWGLAHPADKSKAREKVISFLNGQLATHMAVNGVSEFETPSHFSWWQAALAGIWLLAFRAHDLGVLALVRTWWCNQQAIEDANVTPWGRVVVLGGRSQVGGVDADQTIMRDQGRAILRGDHVHLPADLSTLDRTGLWILQQIPRTELDQVKNGPRKLPTVLDPVHIERWPHGHRCWVDAFHGLRPAYWAWVSYETKEERYGTDPHWPKGQPGGKRPDNLPVPPVPAGSGAVTSLFLKPAGGQPA